MSLYQDTHRLMLYLKHGSSVVVMSPLESKAPTQEGMGFTLALPPTVASPSLHQQPREHVGLHLRMHKTPVLLSLRWRGKTVTQSMDLSRYIAHVPSSL